MHRSIGLFLVALAFSLSGGRAARAQLASATNLNLSQMLGYQAECAIAKNPSNKLQLFALCNNTTPGLFAARSVDGGLSWTYPDPSDKTIADGNPGQGPTACCDPSLSWDTFGNLFVTYVDQAGTDVVTLLSTDGGATFTNLASFGPSDVDQPTVVAATTSAAGAPVAVWVVWNQGGQMVAQGAAVTGLGSIGTFGALQTIPGTTNCSFGDIAIAPTGAVVQVCESPNNGVGPANLLVNTKPDGLGPGSFGAAVTATATNVGGFKPIPPQARRTIDAEAGLAYDINPTSPHLGRLYLVYTDETVLGNNDTDIMVRFSDNDGATWSSTPIRVNDDPSTPIRSQFFPKIASNPDSGNVAICWYDCRNSATNTAMQDFCSLATRLTPAPTFFANAQVSAGASVSSANGLQFGDYSGLAYFRGRFHPIWPDTSNSTGDNPDGTSEFDIYSNVVSGGTAAMEGDPHITTIDGVHYDFQGGGEFTVLRSGDGMVIQTRQTPVATTSIPDANGYTGLSTCVSLNTAVAARVGRHRVSFEPNISGVPDPLGLQLRVDGVLTRLTDQDLHLGADGRLRKSPGGGIAVDFPNGTTLIATPGWWASQGKWYLNVDVFGADAQEGIMGAIARGSWLPLLSDGASLGSRSTDLHQRYVDLYEKFGESWRVTARTSLFDYAPGTTTETFTDRAWPGEHTPCVIPGTPGANPVEMSVAREACKAVVDTERKANCTFDVMFTGELGLAKTYVLGEEVALGSTSIVLAADKAPSKVSETITFTASVVLPSGGKAVPTGAMSFAVNGARLGPQVPLDAHGRARWTTSDLKPGTNRVKATYAPSTGSVFLASSAEVVHTVLSSQGPPPVSPSCRCDLAGRSEATMLGLLSLLPLVVFRLRTNLRRTSCSATCGKGHSYRSAIAA